MLNQEPVTNSSMSALLVGKSWARLHVDLSVRFAREFEIFFVDFLDLSRSLDLISTTVPLLAMFHVDTIDTAIPVAQLLVERGATISHLVGLDDGRSLLTAAQVLRHGYCAILDTTQQAQDLVENLQHIVRDCDHHPTELAFSAERDTVEIAVRSRLVDQTDLQILGLIARGMPDSEIAASLSFSLQTIRNRVSALLAAVGARNRTELAIAWRRHLHRSSFFTRLSA